jgi:hypothetical protein
MNPVEAKVLVEVSRKYVSIFRCDGTGAVVDYDHFSYPFRLDKQQAVSEAVDVYAMLYDLLNDTINGDPDDDSARGDDDPATVD